MEPWIENARWIGSKRRLVVDGLTPDSTDLLELELAL